MKYFLSLIFIYSIVFAVEPSNKDQAEQEIELAVSTVKEKYDEDKIIESNEELKNCTSTNKGNLTKIEECINKVIKNTSAEDIEKLGDKIELKSYNSQAGKDAETIREYLTKRISKAIRGVEPDGKTAREITLKEMKFVDHALYSKIYRSQVGKNILLETTNYCISTLGIKDKPGSLVSHCSTGESQCVLNGGKFDGNAIGSSKTIEKLTARDPNEPYKVIKNIPIKFDDVIRVSTGSTKPAEFWKTYATEFEICDPINEADKKRCEPESTNGEPETTRRSIHVEAFKEFEFTLGAGYMKEKIQFCTQTAIKRMCERYRCKNEYKGKVPASTKKNCLDKVGIVIPYTYPTGTSKDDTGILACGLMDRLKEYRRVIAALDKIDEINKSNQTKGGFAIDSSFKGRYTGASDGDKSIEELTTIGSNELDDLTLTSEADLAEIEEECFVGGVLNQNNPKCKKLTEGRISEEDQEKIESEMAAESAAYIKRIEDLKAKGEDGQKELKEYLKKHGLTKIAEEGNLDSEEMASLISAEYKSQRAALKNSLSKKYAALKKSNKTDEEIADELANVAKGNFSELKQEKKKIQTLIQYSNILSSYLGASISGGDEDGETETTLSYQRQIEFDAAKGGKREEDIFLEANSQYFEDGQPIQSADSANLQVDINFIDTLLGNDEKTKAILKAEEK